MDDAGPSIINLAVEPMLNTLEATANAKSLIWQVPLLVILILVNAFFAMSEIALISLNDAKLEKQADEGNKKAKQVLKLTRTVCWSSQMRLISSRMSSRSVFTFRRSESSTSIHRNSLVKHCLKSSDFPQRKRQKAVIQLMRKYWNL